jgi:hypothetical protein
MITSIKKKFFKAKYPFFVQKTSLNSLNDTGKGRILLCLSEQKSVLIQNGEGDNYKIGEELMLYPNIYSIIDEITFTTEYIKS